MGYERRHADRPSDRRAPSHLSLISAVTARGHIRFMIIEKGSVNAGVFIEFLKRLIKNAGRDLDRRSRPGSLGEESRRFRANAGREIALVLSASLCAGPQPRRVGLEASRSGRPHGGDRSRTISKRKFAARCATRKTTREKSSPSLQGLPSNTPREYEPTYGRINISDSASNLPCSGKNVRPFWPQSPDAEGRSVTAKALRAGVRQGRLPSPAEGDFTGPDGYTLSLFPRQGRGRCKSPLSFAPVLRQARDDPGKGQRDVAIDGHPGCRQVDHDPAGHAALLAWRGRAWPPGGPASRRADARDDR
jgi:hypothetical protein